MAQRDVVFSLLGLHQNTQPAMAVSLEFGEGSLRVVQFVLQPSGTIFSTSGPRYPGLHFTRDLQGVLKILPFLVQLQSFWERTLALGSWAGAQCTVVKVASNTRPSGGTVETKFPQQGTTSSSSPPVHKPSLLLVLQHLVTHPWWHHTDQQGADGLPQNKSTNWWRFHNLGVAYVVYKCSPSYCSPFLYLFPLKQINCNPRDIKTTLVLQVLGLYFTWHLHWIIFSHNV